MADRQNLQNDVERLKTLRREWGNSTFERISVLKIKKIAEEVYIVLDEIRTSNAEFSKEIEKHSPNVSYALRSDVSWRPDDIRLAEVRLQDSLDQIIEAGENWLKKMVREVPSPIQAGANAKKTLTPIAASTARSNISDSLSLPEQKTLPPLVNSRLVASQPVLQAQPQSQEESAYCKLQIEYADLQKKYDDEKRFADNARMVLEQQKGKTAAHQQHLEALQKQCTRLQKQLEDEKHKGADVTQPRQEGSGSESAIQKELAETKQRLTAALTQLHDSRTQEDRLLKELERTRDILDQEYDRRRKPKNMTALRKAMRRDREIAPASLHSYLNNLLLLSERLEDECLETWLNDSNLDLLAEYVYHSPQAFGLFALQGLADSKPLVRIVDMQHCLHQRLLECGIEVIHPQPGDFFEAGRHECSKNGVIPDNANPEKDGRIHSVQRLGFARVGKSGPALRPAQVRYYRYQGSALANAVPSPSSANGRSVSTVVRSRPASVITPSVAASRATSQESITKEETGG